MFSPRHPMVLVATFRDNPCRKTTKKTTAGITSSSEVEVSAAVLTACRFRKAVSVSGTARMLLSTRNVTGTTHLPYAYMKKNMNSISTAD